MVEAPRNLPRTICHGDRGSVSRSSAVPALYSVAMKPHRDHWGEGQQQDAHVPERSRHCGLAAQKML